MISVSGILAAGFLTVIMANLLAGALVLPVLAVLALTEPVFSVSGILAAGFLTVMITNLLAGKLMTPVLVILAVLVIMVLVMVIGEGLA